MLGNVTLPNSWSSMPGPGAGPSAWANAYGQMGAASTAANQQLGNAFVAGSNANLAQQQAALQQAFGYLRGTNRANTRAIQRQFASEYGNATQDLINRGLGNSTIQGSMRTGWTRAFADALSGARAAFGTQMYNAAYQNAIANSGLAQQQLNTQLQATNIGYPDMGAFAQMAAMAGGGLGGYAGGGGGLTVFDPSRPVGGSSPAWAHYAMSAGDEGGYGGYGGGLGGFATGYNVPSWNVAQGPVGGYGGLVAGAAGAFAGGAGGLYSGGGGDF